jgi:hypothetical protein
VLHFVNQLWDGLKQSNYLLLGAGAVDCNHEDLFRLLLQVSADRLNGVVNSLHLIYVNHDLDVASVKVEELVVQVLRERCNYILHRGVAICESTDQDEDVKALLDALVIEAILREFILDFLQGNLLWVHVEVLADVFLEHIVNPFEDNYEIIQGDSDCPHDFRVYRPFDDGKEQLDCFLFETIQKLQLISDEAFNLKLALSSSLGDQITAVIDNLGGDKCTLILLARSLDNLN